MIVGNRIRKARIAAGLSQQVLAHAISSFGDGKTLSRTAIAQLESGATREIEAANLLKAAKVLKVNAEWLQFGTGQMRPATQNQDDLSLADLVAKSIPILSYLQVINPMELDESITYTSIDRELAAVTSPNIFAVIIKGESMLPVLKPGDIVIIDPDIKPLPGEIVIAKLDKDDTVLLRKYRPLSDKSAANLAFELIPLNDYWPKITIDEENSGCILGTLVEHRCRRRVTHTEIQDDNSSSKSVDVMLEDNK